jgi:3-methyl-2-oxobutanoate hydroxymethyltransferase
MVFEKIPASLAREVTAAVDCPTIGIGAGADCDGQVLVLHDMLGITQDFSPRFLRRYSDIGDQMLGAIQNYVSDVRSRDFPSKDEQY